MHRPNQILEAQNPVTQLPRIAQEAGHLLVADSVAAPETKTAAYTIFTNPYERMEYVRQTDDLIITLDGSAEGSTGPYDAVVYLDSSARPVGWMVNSMWDFAAHKDKAGKPVPRPRTYFANIDARRTSKITSPEDIQELSDTFPVLQEWSSDQSRETKPKVLIVDEIAVSGDTLSLASSKLQEAFPGLQFQTYAWKDERGVSNTKRDNVRWYERNNDRYRAVLDAKELSDDQRKLLNDRGIAPSNRWLTVINPDQTGAKLLRNEVERMVQDVQTGNIPYWPSAKRNDDEFDKLVATYNDGLTPRQFRDFREWMRRYYAPSPVANLITTDFNGPLTEKESRAFLDERQLRQRRSSYDPAAIALAEKLGYKK